MLIGITADLQHSMFSAGHPNSCIAIAECLKLNNHEVIFIHKQDRTWWEDVVTLREQSPKCVTLSDILKESRQLDMIIEVAFLLNPSERLSISKCCVWYNRKPGIFSDIEATVYSCRPEGRNLEGISAILSADIFTTTDDVDYLKSLYPSIPVIIVPWIWTPSIVEEYRKEKQCPVWLQVTQSVPRDKKWSVHISETNQSSTSSSTLPILILRHAHTSKSIPISQVNIHNAENIKDNKFFQENVFRHASVIDLSYNFIGRQRVIDWVYDPYSIIISHSRFVPLKMANLEAVWVGLPVIHNNEILRDIGFGLEKLFYKSNSVTGAAKALHTVVFNTNSIEYLSKIETINGIRNAICSRFIPHAKHNEWMSALKQCMVSNTTIPVTVPNSTNNPNSKFSVLFTDMWEQFNESYNIFTLALENALEPQAISVNGYSLNSLPPGTKPDIVIFGPFGGVWKTLSQEWPKVHYTGENTGPVYDTSVKLNIGFYETSDTYLRIPIWMAYIDWFGADHQKIRNPLPLPVDAFTTVKPDYSSRSKFCAFIVSNPSNEIRNNAFNTLNIYKPVDSAGRLFNNTGDGIFAGGGGGGGEIKKHEFLKQYRFNIAYENSSSPGYTTEKLLHAKAAGCVPIYWGDPIVSKDFDERGFLNAQGCNDTNDLIRLVKAVEENPEKWKQLTSIPALDTAHRDAVRKTLSEMVKRFLVISGRQNLVASVPEFLGAKTTEEANAMRNRKGETCIYKTFVVNLDRRSDRMKSFTEYHPHLNSQFTRFPAYDGLKLQLTPSIARLFKPNDFHWKKAVMGCALSHLKLLHMLVNEKPEAKSYFILEDDARLSPDWRDKWLAVYPNLPADWDCVYLGGVLPPNKAGLPSSLEHVAPGLARIAPNKVFGQAFPSRYFHFCTYAYMISRRGATKILEFINSHDGYWTSADHVMCNDPNKLNIYLLDPLPAGASQDDDPAYQTSQFNDFSRVDKFDSDLWNNDERFSLEDVKAQPAVHLNIASALAELDQVNQLNKPIAPTKPPRFVVLDIYKLANETMYEAKWLEEIFGNTPFRLESVSIDDPLNDDNLIAFITRPNWDIQLKWLDKIRSRGKAFKIVHLSDEFVCDPIHMYSWQEVTGVLRFYNRPDLPNDPKILVIPLGYHWQKTGSIKPHSKREFLWSFAGTDWKNRSSNMQPLLNVNPHYLKWLPDWDHPDQLKNNDYLNLLENTMIVPCPKGQNIETYRFYEALECGCIPVFVYTPDYDPWFRQFNGLVPLLITKSWPELANVLEQFQKTPQELSNFHNAVSTGWAKFKVYLKEKVAMWLKN